MRPVGRQQRRHVGGVERTGAPGGRGHSPRVRDGMGRRSQQADQQTARALGARGRPSLER